MRSNILRKRALLAGMMGLGILAGCGNSLQLKPKGDAKPLAGKADALCIATFERQRTCTEVFLPALVALRVRLDIPAGIAETDRKIGRAALLAEAREEWATDSPDPAIRSTCQRRASQADPFMTETEACLASTTCADFVTCFEPILERLLQRVP